MRGGDRLWRAKELGGHALPSSPKKAKGLQSTKVTSELYSQGLCCSFQGSGEDFAKHQDLFQHFEDGGLSAGLNSSKVPYFFLIAQIQKP